MSVPVVSGSAVLDEMYVAAVSYFDSGAAETAEFVVMTFAGIRCETYFVYMVVAAGKCFSGYRCKTVAVRFVAAAFDAGTALKFVVMRFYKARGSGL